MTIRSKSFLLRAVVIVAVFSVVLVAFYGLGVRPFKAAASSPVPPPQEEAASSSKISRSSVKPRPVTETDARFRRLLQVLQREDDEAARVRAEGNGSIRGTVSMGMAGSAQDATVAVSPLFGATDEKTVILKSTKPDQQNNYVISGLALNAQYIVSAGAPGCTTSSQSYYLTNSSDPCNFFLQKKGTGKTFKGIVVDATTSKPLEGVKIIVAQSVPVVSTITDKNGKFRLEDLEYQVSLEVFKDGYFLTDDLRTPPFELRYTFNKDTDPQETDTVIKMFPGAASISGRVVDETSRPLHTSAKICLTSSYMNETGGGLFGALNLHYWTNERGEFSINGLPPNRDLQLYALRGTAGDAVKISLQPGEHKRDLELCVSSLVTVTGRTVDDATGQPVPGVKIQYFMLAQYHEIDTGPDGEFSLLAEPKSGFFLCSASAKGWRFSDSKDRTPLVRIPVPKGAAKVDADIRMTAAPVICGTVTGADGHPAISDGKLRTGYVSAAFLTQNGMELVKGLTDQKGEYSLTLPSNVKKDSPILILASVRQNGVVTHSKFQNNRARVDLKIPDNATTEFAEFYMSDGKPLAETLEANYRLAFYSRNEGLRVDSILLGISDKTGLCPTMKAQWDDVTIRLNLGDGKIVESPVNMEDLMKGPVRFIYDPVAEKITVSHEVAHAQLTGPPNKETGKAESGETKGTK